MFFGLRSWFSGGGGGVLGPSPEERPAFFLWLFFAHAPRGRSCSCAAAAVSLACPCRPICGLLRCLSHSPRYNPPHWSPPLRPRPLAARCESPPLPLPVRLPLPPLSFVWLFSPSRHVPECCTTRVRPARVGWRWWWHRAWRLHGALRPSVPGGSRARPPFGTLAHVPFRQREEGGIVGTTAGCWSTGSQGCSAPHRQLGKWRPSADRPRQMHQNCRVRASGSKRQVGGVPALLFVANSRSIERGIVMSYVHLRGKAGLVGCC